MSTEKQSVNQNGGKRAGAGRKKGEPNKRTAEAQEKAKKAGITPLDYLLSVMTDSSDDKMYDYPKILEEFIDSCKSKSGENESDAKNRFKSVCLESHLLLLACKGSTPRVIRAVDMGMAIDTPAI